MARLGGRVTRAFPSLVMPDRFINEVIVYGSTEDFVGKLNRADHLIIQINYVYTRHGQLPFRPPDQNVCTVRPWHRALNHQHVFLGIDLDDLEIPHRHLIRSQMAGHSGPWKSAGGKAGSADRARSAMEHRTVRSRTAFKMMALDDAAEALALADPDHVHFLSGLELV